MENAVVSIIVPVYNVEKYIYRCLKSIYDQTYQNIEVIIIDDGSPDRSHEIISQQCLFDERFQYYRKENGGLSSARNEGLKYATGEYVMFVDSDDWLLPEFVAQMVEQFGDETDVVIGKYYLEDTVLKKRYIPFESEHINKGYSGIDKVHQIVRRHLVAYPRSGYEIRDTTMPVWKNAYRRPFLDEHNIRFVSERKVFTEDFVFNTEVYCQAREVVVTDTAGYVHEIVADSLSHRFRASGTKMNINRCGYIYEYIRRWVVEIGLDSQEEKQLEEAIVTDFVLSFALQIRNLVGSSASHKIQKIREELSIPEVERALAYPCKYNVQSAFALCIAIVKTKSPVCIYAAFQMLRGANRFYRLYQWMIRK